MNKNSELDCFLFYMWNVWGYDECVAHFSEHIWIKWVEAADECGTVSAPAKFYAELDDKTRKAIVELAVAYYN